MSKLRILHCLRAPVGGLFRHVRDLSAAQAAQGHDVGVIADSAAGDSLTDQRLQELQAHLSLGLHRCQMSRELGWRDLTAVRATSAIAELTGAQIIHGHGAKGGAYGRLAGARLKAKGRAVAAFYTPHGGSLHYAPSSLKGRVFMTLERYLARSTDGIIFESAYSARVYANQVGAIRCPTRIIPNGLLPAEFTAHEPTAGATDLLYIGELRLLKGVDVLLEAMAAMNSSPPVSATIVGDGPDAAQFRGMAARLGLQDRVTFTGAMPASRAFPLGRLLVMPSRAESFPYIVLEAAAASIPLIATSVGGIPEIVAGTDTALVPPGDAAALSLAMSAALKDAQVMAARAARLKIAVANRFTVERMSDAVASFYSEAAR